MRFLKVLGLLLIVAAACRGLLLVVAGHASASTGGRYVGEIVGGGLAIFVVAAIGAGIAALVTRNRGYDFPGLSTGFVVALGVSALVYLGSA